MTRDDSEMWCGVMLTMLLPLTMCDHWCWEGELSLLGRPTLTRDTTSDWRKVRCLTDCSDNSTYLAIGTVQ